MQDINVVCRQLRSSVMAEILRVLFNAKGMMQSQEIAHEVYSGCPDGGPEGAANMVRATISRQKKTLEKFGLEITSKTSCRGGYVLKITKEK